MARGRAARWAGALILATCFEAGCAGRWSFHQGQAAAEKGDWDLAVARLTRALDKDRKNIGYKIALENARIQASRYHYDQARKQLAANELAKAVDELQIAANYDPANRSAADDLVLVRRRLQKQQQEQRDREEFDQVKARAGAVARLPVPVLSPRETAPITMRFDDASIQKIFETLGKLASVNVLFDESFRDKKISFALRDLSFEEALDRLTLVNRLFYKVLDQNTLIVAAESRVNRQKYDEMLLRTFYLQNAEINETANLIKTIAKVTTVGANTALGAITVLGTVDQMAMAERIIEANDKPRGEVVVEVQILEVSRSATRNWGLGLANYQASATLAPGTNDTSGTLNIRAYLLSALNQADWIVSIPSQVFTQFLQNDATTRILAAPRLRAAEGKKTEMKIGTEVPIPVTSIGVGIGSQQQGGLGGYYPATSFQYKNVGVTMSLQPTVAASGDVKLEIQAEFSLLGDNRNIGSDQNKQEVPTFLTRTINANLRLREGETALIGGLVQGRDARTFGGAIGMGDIPILGKLLGSHSRIVEDSEILMSITPRIVRGPKLTEEDMIPLRVGTQEVPHVEGARPPLFGPETEPKNGVAGPPAPASGAGPATGPAPAGAKSGGAAKPGARPAPAASTPASPTLSPATAAAAPPGAPPVSAAAPTPTAPPPTAPTPIAPTPIAPTPQTEPATLTPSAPTTGAPAPAPATAAPGAGAPISTTPGAPAAAPAALAAAPTSLLWSPPEVSLRAGQSAGISVVLVGGRDVQSVELVLLFDPTLVEITDVTPGSLLTLDGQPVQTERTIEPGRARLRFNRATPVTGSGGVAMVTLRGLRPGAGPLAVESSSVGRAGGATELPAAPTPGRLVVAP